MTQRILERIRHAILHGHYDLTFHAVEELAEDNLDIRDLESAVLSGRIIKSESDDPRGPRYTILGPTVDGKTMISVVGRFPKTDVSLVITVYAVDD